MNWQTFFIHLIATIVTTLLTTLTSWLLIKLRKLVATKIKNQQAQALLFGALNVVESVVKATYQSYVESIKGTDAWTLETQKEALNKAMQIAETQLSTETKEFIDKNFGDVHTWIKNQIEATLYELKNKGE